jgi:imidazolonepropionase
MAIATDHNPGSSPALSLPLMLSMACTLFRLTPEEALRGATVNGARALGLRDRGTLVAGQRADFAAWDLEHPNELSYWFGSDPCRRVVAGGRDPTAP